MSIPLLFATSVQMVLTKTLLAMGKSKPVLCTSIANLALVGGLVWLLVISYGHGLVGAAIARTAAVTAQALALLAAVACDRECRACWPGLTCEGLRGWCSYLKLGAPAGFMLLCVAGDVTRGA